MSTPRFLLLSIAFLLGNYASVWLGILPDWEAAHERTYVQLTALLFAFACLRCRVSVGEEGAMKTKTQKRLEAANRLDRLAGDIDAGRSWVWSAPEDRFRDAQKRRDEAKRLRDMSGTK